MKIVHLKNKKKNFDYNVCKSWHWSVVRCTGAFVWYKEVLEALNHLFSGKNRLNAYYTLHRIDLQRFNIYYTPLLCYYTLLHFLGKKSVFLIYLLHFNYKYYTCSRGVNTYISDYQYILSLFKV